METTHTQEKVFPSIKEKNKHNNSRRATILKISISNVVFKYGLIGGACYILNFFLFKILGLVQVIELSFINFVILAIVAFMALSRFKAQTNGLNKMGYLEGLATAFFIGVVSFAVLSVFMVFYLTYIDAPFMSYIQSKNLAGISVTPSSIAIILFIEGAAIGAIIALVLMQYFKKRLNQS